MRRCGVRVTRRGPARCRAASQPALCKQRPVHRAERYVAQTGHQGQRHGVGNVGTNDTRQRLAEVHQQQHRDTDGARAHRGERDQRCRSPRPAQHRQAPVAGGVTSPVWALRAAFWAAWRWAEKQSPCRRRGGGREQQGKAQRGGHDALGRAQGVQRQSASRAPGMLPRTVGPPLSRAPGAGGPG